MEEIEFEISPSGKVTVRTKGIKGERCIDVAEAYARIIGNIESRETTSELHEEDVEVERHVERKLKR